MRNIKEIIKAIKNREIQIIDEQIKAGMHYIYWHINGDNPVMLTMFDKKGRHLHQGLSRKYSNY
jgi:hypothetical protein